MVLVAVAVVVAKVPYMHWATNIDLGTIAKLFLNNAKKVDVWRGWHHALRFLKVQLNGHSWETGYTIACVAGTWKKWAQERMRGTRETREGKGIAPTSLACLSRAPRFSCTHYFQAPATQARYKKKYRRLITVKRICMPVRTGITELTQKTAIVNCMAGEYRILKNWAGLRIVPLGWPFHHIVSPRSYLRNTIWYRWIATYLCQVSQFQF